MYTYRQAITIKKQLDELLKDSAVTAKLGFDETLITLIQKGGDRELEEFEKEIAWDAKDWTFNVTLLTSKENGGIEAFNYDDGFLERIGFNPECNTTSSNEK